MVLTFPETIRLVRNGEKVGEGGMEVGGRGRLYTYRYTVTTTEILHSDGQRCEPFYCFTRPNCEAVNLAIKLCP